MNEPNYREMYYYAMREMEKAMNILIRAQQSCEERYIAAKEPPLAAETAACDAR